METSLKKSCLGSLYLANAKAIQLTFKFKVAEAREKNFELVENTWAIYSTGTIDVNQIQRIRSSLDRSSLVTLSQLIKAVTSAPWIM
jgi:hypothetical protein